MSFWKQRECAVVICNLIRWTYDDKRNTVTGIVQRSLLPKEYPEGERWTILNVKLSVKFPFSEQYGEGHMLATTETGKSFRLNAIDGI